MNYVELIRSLIPTALEAGSILMRHKEKGLRVRTKDDGSPVTEADEEAETYILSALAKIAPDIPIISEENVSSHKLAPAERFFLVDALDGTRDYIEADSRGDFTVNIALVEKCVPIAGIVYAPAHGRCCYGVVGEFAQELIQGIACPIRVRSLPSTGPVVLTSRRFDAEGEEDKWIASLNAKHRQKVSSSFKFCLIATGEADIYPCFRNIMEWDTAAGDAILRAAGGATLSLPEYNMLAYGKKDYRNSFFVATSGAFNLSRHENSTKTR